jgi:hypothetical protein
MGVIIPKNAKDIRSKELSAGEGTWQMDVMFLHERKLRNLLQSLKVGQGGR